MRDAVLVCLAPIHPPSTSTKCPCTRIIPVALRYFARRSAAIRASTSWASRRVPSRWRGSAFRRDLLAVDIADGARSLSGSSRDQRELPCPWVSERFRPRPRAGKSSSARGNQAPVHPCQRSRLLGATRHATFCRAAPQTARQRRDGSPRQRLPAGHSSPNRRHHSRSPAVSPRQRQGVRRRCSRRRESLDPAAWERRARGGAGAGPQAGGGRGGRRDERICASDHGRTGRKDLRTNSEGILEHGRPGACTGMDDAIAPRVGEARVLLIPWRGHCGMRVGPGSGLEPLVARRNAHLQLAHGRHRTTLRSLACRKPRELRTTNCRAADRALSSASKRRLPGV